jgi:L-aspartate semialdehyde sulfurtransferase ferredoxin
MMSSASRTFHLTFPGNVVSEPLLYRIYPDFGLVPNIRRANIDERGGWVIVELDGDGDAIERCLTWLASVGVTVDRIDEE